MTIEQLLERYFNADTTLSEERQLREFFASDQVPAHLEQYRAMFAAIGSLSTSQSQQSDPTPKSQLSTINYQLSTKKTVRAHRITLGERLRPLFRVAACIGIVVSVLMAAEQGMRTPTGIDILEPSNTQSVGVEVSELGTAPITVEPDTATTALP